MSAFDSPTQARASIAPGDVVIDMQSPLRVVEVREEDLLAYDHRAATLATVEYDEVEHYVHRSEADLEELNERFVDEEEQDDEEVDA